MQEITKFTPGTFCWIELFTTNVNAAKEYYIKLFNWGIEEIATPDNQTYTMPQVDGKPMGGLFPLSNEMKANGVPPHWMSYVGVTSADDVTKKAKELGANIIKEPFDVGDYGRMSVIQDPVGAVFNLWQPTDQNSPGIARNVAGSLSWNELYTPDINKSKEFYCSLFGWEANTIELNDSQIKEYVEFKQGEISIGGMMSIREDMDENRIHPHWMVYLAVNDCDENAALSERLGGKILYAPKHFPGVGKMAVIQDPQGAVYSTINYQPES